MNEWCDAKSYADIAHTNILHSVKNNDVNSVHILFDDDDYDNSDDDDIFVYNVDYNFENICNMRECW